MITVSIFWLIDLLTRPLYHLISYFTSPKSIPPSDVEILHTSASELADRIRRRKVTSEEVVKAFIKRCQEVNPLVNAIIEDRFEKALAEAKQVDVFLKKNLSTVSELKSRKPLLGVPFSVKESCQVKGMKCTMGVNEFSHRRSSVNGKAVQLLLDAGAIPLAVTSTSPYCLWLETVNEIIGYTPNPYNLTKTVGGSSGGEAALISSGASILGLASDSGGSIRLPCAFAGIYGHKPSHGLVPCDEHFATMLNSQLADMLVVGPICRYVEDLELLMGIFGMDKQRRLPSAACVNSLKIYYTNQLNDKFLSTNKAVKDKMSKAIDYLRDVCGCEVEQLADLAEMASTLHICSNEVKNIMSEIPIKKLAQKGYMNLVVAMVEPAMKLLQLENDPEYANMKVKLKHKLESLLSTRAVLLLPSYPESVFYKYQSLWKMYKCTYTLLISLLGLPATNIPAGLDNKNMPVGLQIVASPNNDWLCIMVAKELDRLFGGWAPPYNATQ